MFMLDLELQVDCAWSSGSYTELLEVVVLARQFLTHMCAILSLFSTQLVVLWMQHDKGVRTPSRSLHPRLAKDDGTGKVF